MDANNVIFLVIFPSDSVYAYRSETGKQILMKFDTVITYRIFFVS